MRLIAKQDSEGRWTVSDGIGHLVPMIEVYISSEYAESLAKTFASAPDILDAAKLVIGTAPASLIENTSDYGFHRSLKELQLAVAKAAGKR